MTATGLVTLFVGSLLASTVLPGGVEVLLYAMVESGRYSSLSLLAVASIGNTCGGVLTYAVGFLLRNGINRVTGKHAWRERFKLSETALARVRRWGLPCLLFSWLPLLGDPLCAAAGYLRLPFLPSVVLIALGKLARYWVLLWLFGWR